MKALLSLLALIAAATVSNAKPNYHDEALVILEGVDRVNGKKCELYVLEVNDLGLPSVSLKVATSYSHNKDSVEPIILNNLSQTSLSGMLGKSTLALLYNGSSLNFENVTQFNLRWMHVNHFHNYSCMNLKVHDHNHDDDHNDHK